MTQALCILQLGNIIAKQYERRIDVYGDIVSMH